MALAGLQKEEIVQPLLSEETFATVLLVICIDAFTTECFEWDPDVLLRELEEEYAVELSQVNRDKINAILTIMTTDQFYRDPMVFWQIGNVLSGTPANFQTGADPLTVDEAAWAVVEAAYVDRPDGDLKQPVYSPEVAATVGAILKVEGYVSPPRFLKFAKIPERRSAMDLASEQAQAKRTETLGVDLQEMIRTKCDLLNQQLQRLPFVSRGPESDPMKPRDFLAETLSQPRVHSRT